MAKENQVELMGIIETNYRVAIESYSIRPSFFLVAGSVVANGNSVGDANGM